MKKITLFLSLLFSFSASVIFATEYKISEGYSVKFSSENPSGIFKTMSGTISFDEKKVDASKFDISIDVASISTGNGLKNKHAKSDNWFDAKKYPAIKFVSTKVVRNGSNYEMTGNLEIHGVKKPITFPFTFTNNIFRGNFEVNRLDYGVGTDKGMSANASKMLKIEITVPVK